MEKAKYGKMRQVNAVNGSQMVVKIGVVYYRRVKGKFDRKMISDLLFHFIADNQFNDHTYNNNSNKQN